MLDVGVCTSRFCTCCKECTVGCGSVMPWLMRLLCATGRDRVLIAPFAPCCGSLLHAADTATDRTNALPRLCLLMSGSLFALSLPSSHALHAEGQLSNTANLLVICCYAWRLQYVWAHQVRASCKTHLRVMQIHNEGCPESLEGLH